ncbi:MAG: AAA family ATPase [Saprospiraceae bacterium]|nr:AAA family ATPase [Saprospiraceae bacterium]
MKVVFTGPESSGKTSLALWLCDGFDYHYVPEVARAYLEMVELPYHAGHVKRDRIFASMGRTYSSSEFLSSLL